MLTSNANQKINQMYEDTGVDPEKRLSELSELLPMVVAPELLGVGGGTGIAAKLGEMAPGAIQKAAQLAAGAGEVGARKGIPLAGGAAFAASGHPIAGLEMAAGALSEQPLRMGGILMYPASMVNYFANWTGDQMGKLSDLLGTAGQPGEVLSESIANNLRSTAAQQTMDTAMADLKAQAKPEELAEWLQKKPDGTYVHNMDNAPKPFKTFLETEQQAADMGSKANSYGTPWEHGNKVLSNPLLKVALQPLRHWEKAPE